MTAGLLELTKHHALGNDFLVLLAPPAGLDTAALARHLCHRRHGVGADGLLLAYPGAEGVDVVMELRNADGGRAQMSGNGIRCLAQAVWGATAADLTGLAASPDLATRADLAVGTDAGPRLVRRIGAPRADCVLVAVDMGPVKVVADAPEHVTGSARAAVTVDVGNPHLVVLDPASEMVEVAVRGPRIQAMFPEGVNVEWITPGPGDDELALRVWERGAGETQACGTGSCAAAAAAAAWGLVGRRVVVHNPGGDVVVELGETAVLTGEATRVASVAVPWR